MNWGDGFGCLACGEGALWTEEVDEEEDVLVLVGVCGGVYGGAGWEWEWECRCLP